MSKLRTVSQNIRVIARYLDDDKWEETKDLMEKQPSFRRGLAHFLRCYADDVERAFVSLGGKSDMAQEWQKMQDAAANQ